MKLVASGRIADGQIFTEPVTDPVTGQISFSPDECLVQTVTRKSVLAKKALKYPAWAWLLEMIRFDQELGYLQGVGGNEVVQFDIPEFCVRWGMVNGVGEPEFKSIQDVKVALAALQKKMMVRSSNVVQLELKPWD